MFIYTIVFNIIQGNFVTPLVYGKAVSLHPAIVLLAVPIGNALAGIVGMFLVVPVAGVIATTWRAVLQTIDASEVVVPEPLDRPGRTSRPDRPCQGSWSAGDGGRRQPQAPGTCAGDLAARAALLFWLIVIALVGVIGVLTSGIADTLGPGRHPVHRLAHGLRPRAGGHVADAPPAVPLAGSLGRRDLPGDGRGDLCRPARRRRRPPERRDDVRGAPTGDRGPCARTGRAARDVTRSQPARPDRSRGRDRGPVAETGRPSATPPQRACRTSSSSLPGSSPPW